MKSIFRIAKSIAALALAICAAAPAVALTVTTTSGNGQIALSWTVEAGATAYRVEHATTSGGPYAELASGLAATAMRCSYSADGENWTEDYVGTVGGANPEVYVGVGIGVTDTELVNVNFDDVSLKRLNAETLVVIR
ncbi:MAG: hypothetical protein PHW08_02820 [Kiritimatiellae bacterium]|nr:hypothetical protein [Kiritimatiellia bacterium]